MKDKMNTFQEDEELRDLAIKRALGQMVIEGEKRDEYEKGKEKGSYQERLSNTILLFENIYPEESSDFLKECKFEQLENIFHLLLQKSSLDNIYQLIKK